MHKRILSLALAICILISHLPVVSLAADTVGEKQCIAFEVHKNPLYPELGQYAVPYFSGTAEVNDTPEYLTEESDVVAQIRSAMENRQASTTIYYKTTEEPTGEKMKALFKAALEETGTATQGDYLRFVWQWYGTGGSYTWEDGYYLCTFMYEFLYYTTAAQEAAVTAQVDSLMDSFAFTETTPEYEKVKTIYDYICDHVTYDYENLNDSSYMLKYSAYAALINGTSVCQGYATLFYRLALEAGLSARVISGTSSGGNHAWNIVRLGEKYYNLDSTWDAGVSPYGYFLKNEENFTDHLRGTEYTTDAFYEEYPMAEEDFPVPSGDGEDYVCPDDAHTPVIRDQVTGDCQNPGYSGDTYCAVCGTLLEAGTSVPGNHIAVTDPAVEATCTQTGLTEGSHCSLCGEVFTEQEVVSKKDHDLGEWEVGTEPDCTIPGEKYRTCSQCDYSETQEIEADGHSYVPETTPPQCTDQGYTTFTCSTCGDSYKDNYVDAQGHDEVTHEAKAPTCTEIGWDAYVTCSRCDYTTYEGKAKLGHDEVPHGAKEATCTESGWDAYVTCSRCDYTTYAEIPSAGHTDVVDKAVEATCTATGLTEGKHCSVCSAVTVKQDTVPVKAHTEVVDKAVAATCTAAGLTEGKHCSVCNTVIVKQNEVPALGHKEESVKGKAATCTENGLTDGKKCSVCNAELKKQENIPAKGHSFQNGKCTVCSAEDPNYVKPTEPKPTEPAPTEPKPTEPKPTEPAPTEPKPTEPNPTEPKPTDPAEPETPTVTGVTRVYGSNRYATGFAVSDQLKKNLGTEKFDTIIVAYGSNFADALAGSYLAAQKKAPILLVNKNTVNDVKTYISENLASGGTVYLLGGTAAVPAEMETALSGMNVERLAGANRYATNLLILNKAGTSGQEILICTGKGFADSLSASAINKPILLVNKKLDKDQKEFLKNSSGKFIIIGGESAVSAELEAELKAYGSVERVSGANRYETSVKVAERFFTAPKTAVLAYAKKFPDGLCGGPLACSLNAPLILTATKVESAASAYTKRNGITDGIVLGGEGLISEDSKTQIFG